MSAHALGDARLDEREDVLAAIARFAENYESQDLGAQARALRQLARYVSNGYHVGEQARRGEAPVRVGEGDQRT